MTSPIDVNEAFAAERAQQIDWIKDAPARAAAAQADADARYERQKADFDKRIADGKLRNLGNGRYQVTDPNSWDNGEIWTLRKTTIAGQQVEMVMPEHGLDMSLGRAAVYSRVPMWHELGNVVPEGVKDVDKVLDLSGCNFDVVRRPVLYQNELDGDPQLFKDFFVTVRTDTNTPLGVVGSRYTVIQNREGFEFLQELVDNFDVVWESAGALREGRRVFISLRLPNNITIDADGINDEIIPFIVAILSHDGRAQNQVVVTPWRPVCGNTERFAVRDAYTRWGFAHFVNYKQRMEEARRTLGLSVKYYEQFAAEEESLARTDMTIDDFHAVLEDLWATPEEDDPQRAKTTHANRLLQLDDLWATNTERLGKTAYAAERAITEFADWKTNLRPTGGLRGKNLAARATAVMEGTQDELKTKAHRRLLTLVRH